VPRFAEHHRGARRGGNCYTTDEIRRHNQIPIALDSVLDAGASSPSKVPQFLHSLKANPWTGGLRKVIMKHQLKSPVVSFGVALLVGCVAAGCAQVVRATSLIPRARTILYRRFSKLAPSANTLKLSEDQWGWLKRLRKKERAVHRF
jgi:hypothetical protein